MRTVLAAAALVAAPTAQAQSCLSTTEAQAVAQVALPEIIRETGRVCQRALPSTSLVRRTSGPFIAKYQAAADAAWPAASAAIGKLSDPSLSSLVQSDYARPLLVSLLVPQLVGRVATSDCATIDTLVTQLSPLPARNTAVIVVTTLRYLKAEQAKGNRRVGDVPDLPICTGRR
jgi:hypothetical protein